ncbi:MAG: amidase family protein, partial [Acidimicrobiia bacterium]
VWLEDPATQIDREVLTLLQNAADALSDAGAKVEDAHPNVSFAEQRNLFVQLIISAISPSMAYDPTVEDAGAASGAHLSWLQADEARARLRAIWADWFRDYDALLCPVLPVPAFPHDHTADFMTRTLTINGEQQPYPVVTDWTGLIGIVGLPSAVAPVGRTPAGLPVGIQVVAPYLRDRESVRLAGIVADVSGGGYQPPPGF